MGRKDGCVMTLCRKMENLAWYALNHRIAPQHLADKELTALEEFVSQMCIAAGERWREEWSEVCNENQILSNTCDESLEFTKELIKERDAFKHALEGVMYWDNGKPEWSVASSLLGKSIGKAIET